MLFVDLDALGIPSSSSKCASIFSVLAFAVNTYARKTLKQSNEIIFAPTPRHMHKNSSTEKLKQSQSQKRRTIMSRITTRMKESCLIQRAEEGRRTGCEDSQHVHALNREVMRQDKRLTGTTSESVEFRGLIKRWMPWRHRACRCFQPHPRRR